mmetsp:Transcript_18412/g.16065  ORF Transcript_18412/g.16065 Transcript_18412/m.16065 type:complete len:107 (+) Transcript_18412:61-381(+)
MLQLICGLEYLHQLGYAHLDLNMNNLLLDADFTLQLCDFDQSYQKGDLNITSRGSIGFRPPEIAEDTCKDPFASDIYSLGIIMFVLKSGGYLPYTENMNEQGEMDL